MADALVKFIANDLVPEVDDKRLKFTLCLAKKALHENERLMDGFLRSPIVANVIKEEGGEYDADTFLRIMKNVLGEDGSYSITVPKVPMFAPKEMEMMVDADDIDKLAAYLKAETPTAVA